MWVLLGLLVASGLGAWLTEVPMYASGSAIVVEGSQASQATRDEATLVVLMPFEQRPQVGQALWLQCGARDDKLHAVIVAVEPGISSPADVHRRFGVEGNDVLRVSQPVVVGFARFESSPNELPVRDWIGSVCPVAVQIGSRRVLSLLTGAERQQ